MATQVVVDQAFTDTDRIERLELAVSALVKRVAELERSIEEGAARHVEMHDWLEDEGRHHDPAFSG